VFVEQGTVADVFQPGSHELITKNLPVLSKLRGWKYGFASPFKADVVFVSTRQFTANKWGTRTPVMMRDPELGPVRLRAYGTYTMRVHDAESFVTELVGSNATFTIEQITDQVRDLVVARFSELLGERAIPVLALASNYRELGDQALVEIQPELARMGVALAQLVVESIALPDEVAATLDQRTRMSLIGDVGAYAQLQAADAIRDSARNQGGGGAGVGIGVGLAMARQVAATATDALQPPRAPATPPPLPTPAGFFVAEAGKPVGPLDSIALAQYVRDGRLRPDTLVWREGMAGWAAASQVPDMSEVLKTV
ncbi:MAG: SPFH domain-containing protein, partial [bacterium]